MTKMKTLVMDMINSAFGYLSFGLEDGAFSGDEGGYPTDWSEMGLDPMERFFVEGEEDAIYLQTPDGATYRIKVTKVRKKR